MRESSPRLILREKAAAEMQRPFLRGKGQALLCTTSPSSLTRCTSPCQERPWQSRKVNGFARGSPTRGAVERSETERLYKDGPCYRGQACKLSVQCLTFGENAYNKNSKCKSKYAIGAPKGKTPSRSCYLRKGVLFSAYGPSAIRQATCRCSRTLHSLRRTEQKKKYTP